MTAVQPNNEFGFHFKLLILVAATLQKYIRTL